jgi:small subunit ribosomal protein S6
VKSVNKYETLYVITPELEEEAIKAAIEKFSGIIAANGGVVESVDEWGKRRLAYPIDYKTEGYYVLVNFEAESELPKELERNFNNDESILRFIVVRKDA